MNIHLLSSCNMQPAASTGPRAGDRTGQWSASPSHARATAGCPHRRPRRAARRVRGPHHLALPQLTVITLLRPPRCCSAPRLTPCSSLAAENFHRLCGSGLAAELRVTCDHFYLLHPTEASSDQAVYRWRAGPHAAPVPTPHRANPSQPHKLMMIMVITHSRLKYKSRFLTFTDKMFISAQGSRAALAQYGADTGQRQRELCSDITRHLASRDASVKDQGLGCCCHK